MALVKGRDFLIYIGDGGGPEVFNKLGALRTNSLSLNNRPVDITNKDTTAGFTAWDTAASVKEFQISGEGFLDAANAALQRLQTVARSQDPVANFEIRTGETGTSKWSGAMIIESLNLEGPTEGPVSYSLALRNKGDMTYTP